MPSLGGAGERDAVADLKRRQQQQLAPAYVYDDAGSVSSAGYAASSAPSHAPSEAPSRAPSSLRPLPVIPTDPGGPKYPDDEPPPVYTLQ
jgi:hypothetical protein